MDMKETRRRRMAQLERELGGQGELIRITGLTESQLSNLKNGHTSFGEKAARKLEKLTGKSPYWLDDIEIKHLDKEGITRRIEAVLAEVPPEARDQFLQEIAKGK